MEHVLREELDASHGMVADGKAIVPRFIVFTPHGEYVVFVPLPDEAEVREQRLRLLAGFLAWKMATSFVMSAELQVPDAISAITVTRNERHGLLRRIDRGPPIAFGPIEYLDEGDIDDTWTAILPKRESSLTAVMVRELERAFGEQGEMIAIRRS